jgi:hypothetical protein
MQSNDNEDLDADDSHKDFASTSVLVPQELHSALRLNRLTSKIYLRARLKLGGAIIATHETHKGNSQIMFSVHDQEPVPAVIKYIFSLDNYTVKLAVHCLQKTERPNPFCHYPDFPAVLRKTALEDNLTLITPKDISSYFVSYTAGNESDQFCVVIPVSKVRTDLIRRLYSHLDLYQEQGSTLP